MNVGLLGARMDNTGLGAQTWEFFRHIKPVKTLVVKANPEMAHFPERFKSPGTMEMDIDGLLNWSDASFNAFLDDLDIVFCCETPYNWDFFQYSRARGVKTVLQFNWEFLRYTADPHLPYPDALASPSPWHYQETVERFGKKAMVITLPTPIATDRFIPSVRSKITRVKHIPGLPTTGDRNGTEIVSRAVELFKEPVEFEMTSPKVDGVVNYWENLTGGDLLLMPRRFGGQSLVLQEAMATGMIPMVLESDPYAQILPPACLIPTTGVKEIQVAHGPVECYNTTPELVAEKVDRMVRLAPTAIQFLSKKSISFAEELSWKRWLPIYIQLFSSLLDKRDDRSVE